MGDLIEIKTNERLEQLVSARDLHQILGVKTPYTQWFDRMCGYGFVENVDYTGLSQKSEKGILPANGALITTIVSTDLAKAIAKEYNLKLFEVLTGFKFIGEKMRIFDETKEFSYQFGFEESYGYLVGDFVRDKDSLSTCCILAEMCAWAKLHNKTIYDILLEIYDEFGYYQEGLVSVVRKGKTGAEEIQQMMTNFRNNPPTTIIGQKVVKINDYELQVSKDLVNQTAIELTLPKSNVLQFFLEDGSKISVRPSGTEPKIKFYFGVRTEYNNGDDFNALLAQSEQKIANIKKELNLI